MDAVTHPSQDVVREVMAEFVPCRLESLKEPELLKRLNVRWLPGVAVVDAADRPAHVSIGFLPPADLLTELAFGRAVALMGAKRYDEAHALFARVADTPGAERAPEACFWWGISRYRQSKDFRAAIEEPWRRIVERFPQSQWARKVGFMLGQPHAS
jgi:TolA-binding protein